MAVRKSSGGQKVSPELQKFQATCKRLRADVTKYVTTGGDWNDADSIETKLIRRRDNLQDQLRKGLSSDDPEFAVGRAELETTVEFMKGFRDRASEQRSLNDRARIKAAEEQSRARLVETGMAGYVDELKLLRAKRKL